MGDFQRPTPMQMLYDMQTHYMETGKHYDENAMREYVNAEFRENKWEHPDIPLRPVSDPVIFGENPERARAIRRDDPEAVADLDSIKKRTAQDYAERQAQDNAEDAAKRRLQNENEELRRRLASFEARENGGEPTLENQQPHPSTAVEGESVEMVGRPNDTWTITQLEEYAKKHSIPLPGEGPRLRTVGKAKVFEIIRDVQVTRNHPDFAEE